MLSAFTDEGVEYLLVGAYALAAHGVPRATGDIDLWVRPSSANADRVWRALTRFGTPLDDLTRDDFVTPDRAVQIGVVPSRVDILTAIDGVGFDAAWPERTEVAVAGLTVPVIGRRHLIENKRSTCGSTGTSTIK